MSGLVTIDPSSAVAVTSYLEQARTWLATAVESTGPEQIARAKAEIATAAEAAKQLNLSREIQDDAVEMVRRAEYALHKSIRKGQAEGTVATAASNLIPAARTRTPDERPSSTPRSPREFFGSKSELESVRAMADADQDDFDTAIDEARAEGNLSRANVARKAREITGKPRKTPRRPINETARHAGLDLISAIERIERVLNDDRYASEAEQVAPLLRNHLNSAIESCQGLLDRIASTND